MSAIVARVAAAQAFGRAPERETSIPDVAVETKSATAVSPVAEARETIAHSEVDLVDSAAVMREAAAHVAHRAWVVAEAAEAAEVAVVVVVDVADSSDQ